MTVRRGPLEGRRAAETPGRPQSPSLVPGVGLLRKGISLAACLMALMFAFAGPARAQTGGGTEYAGVLEDSFVFSQNEKGETVCRVAPPEERDRARAAAATHVISRGAPPRRKVLDY